MRSIAVFLGALLLTSCATYSQPSLFTGCDWTLGVRSIPAGPNKFKVIAYYGEQRDASERAAGAIYVEARRICPGAFTVSFDLIDSTDQKSEICSSGKEAPHSKEALVTCANAAP